jgi:hypothetical protein
VKRDTPVDTPLPTGVGEIIEAPQLGIDPAALGAQALVRARSVETLEALYAAWAELNASAVTARKKWKEERQRLEEQGALLLGAMRAAAGSTPAAGDGLVLAAREAETRLSLVKSEFARQVAAADATLTQKLERLRAELFERVKRQSTVSRPAFRLAVRNVGERRILHARRLNDDDAVVALFAFTGRIPSRFGYLGDDSTDDVMAAPPSLYADEGLTDVRPNAVALRGILNDRAQMWPVKGQLPLMQGERFVRWIARGAVLEAELADGEGWRNLLTREEAEQLTGLLLSLKLAGKLEFELVRD